MRPEDFFLGPILRRTAPDLVVVCLATTVPMNMRFSVREAGATAWLAHDDAALVIDVTNTLHFYFARIRPASKLPVGRLLEYGIAVPGAAGWDYAPFEAVVKRDSLAYPGLSLPTFFIQRPGSQLTVLYGSCRKVHDDRGGKLDALAHGDDLIAKGPRDLTSRPNILCLGGDQIYADDVHDLVWEEVRVLARRIQSPAEDLPGPGRNLGPGKRKTILKRYAKFTSDDLDKHLVRLSEYLALYGLMWNQRNWSTQPAKLRHFFQGLPAVRRLLANVPTYMIFDDHDVTDDWNLSERWRNEVSATELGRRIVANALMAYWLCQDYGNDPDRYAGGLDAKLVGLIQDRGRDYEKAERAFWAIDNWEFASPTEPLIYFVDTRTQRGYQDEPARRDPSAPAFLRTLEAWSATMKRLNPLLKRQDPSRPLVLVTAAPVFGFSLVETLQGFISFFLGDYKYDYENWSANEEHFNHFLELMSGRNVVVLSGDVHYAFTSTVRFTIFDSRAIRGAPGRTSPTGGLRPLPVGRNPTYAPVSEARFVQLTSSALKNYASGVTRFLARWTSTDPATIVTEDGDERYGRYENGVFIMLERRADGTGFEQVIRLAREVRPATLFRQRINDAYNTDYLEEHNLGVMQLRGTTVRHYFQTPKGRKSERSWDFSSAKYWE